MVSEAPLKAPQMLREPKQAACRYCDWHSEQTFTMVREVMDAVRTHCIEAHPEVFEKRPKAGHESTRADSAGEGEQGASEAEDAEEPSPHSKTPKRPQVKGQFRFQSFEIDHSVVYLHQLVMASAESKGVNYSPTLGEFLRETSFRYFMEHPEIIDLKAILSADDLAVLTTTGGDQ